MPPAATKLTRNTLQNTNNKKHVADPNRKLRVVLRSGDVLVMKGATQRFWKHCVPKRAPPSKYGPRINVTFRCVVAAAAAQQGG